MNTTSKGAYFLFYLYLSKGIFAWSFAHKIAIAPTHIKATAKEFWWGALQKFPHLIATRMAFWLGAFSKIQSMFTISPHIKALGKSKS